MGSLVRYLLFAFLTGQSDQHLGNWGIIEYDDGRIEFLPFYDNERFMSSSPAVLTLRFFVSRDITYVNKYNLFLSGTLKDNFDYFQKVSCLEYTLVLQEALGLLSDESLKYIIDRIEKKTQAKMPNDIQNDLFSRFKEHRKFLEIILNDKTILELPNISSRLEKRTADKFMKAFQEKNIDTIKEILLPNHEWVHFHPTDISNETTFIFREAYENHSLEELANDFYEYVEVLDYQYERTHYSSLEYTFSYIVHLKIKEEIEMGMKLNGNKKYLTFGSYSYIHTESIKRVQENYPEIWQKILFFLCW